VRPTTPSAIPASRRERTIDEVYEKIYISILEHRLLPGTKLPEERLAAIFGVSRARIREVLGRLAYEQIVEIYPNKGAYIARPSVEQAREIFEARLVIEPAVMRILIESGRPGGIEELAAHVEREMKAHAGDDKRQVIRLSGEFHNLAADLAGNSALARSLRELTSLTCLIILLYDAPTPISCRPDDHARIVDALRAGDASQAIDTMVSHLRAIESSLDLRNAVENVDLEAIFGE
jgi:DNA-binding GntR family transcriptional regulator